MSYIQEILNDLGLEGKLRRGGTELETNCPFHEDRHPSFYVNLETGAWFCHAGCGGGAFQSLVEKLEAIRPRQPGQIKVEAELESFLARGITTEMMKRWGIRWNPDVKAIEIEAHDDSGKFIGYIWRMPEGARPKYRYWPGFPRAEILFGLNRLGDRRGLILVEGPLDAIWLQEAGLPGVAVLGSYLSDGQLGVLKRNKVQKVALCYDNDKAGRQGVEAAASRLRGAGIWVMRIELPTQYKDIQEVPLPKVREVICSETLCVNGSGVVHPRFRRWLAQTAGSNGVHWPWKY